MECHGRALTPSIVTTAALNVPWGVREVEGLIEVESEEIVGVRSRGVGKLVVDVGFSTVDPEGVLCDSVRLAPSERSVNGCGLMDRSLRTVGRKGPGRRCRGSWRIKREKR
jgi:hypothetical protein